MRLRVSGADDAGTRYETTAFSCDPVLGTGVAPGQSAWGWISFEVPRATCHPWAAFTTLDGNEIFGVLLF